MFGPWSQDVGILTDIGLFIISPFCWKLAFCTCGMFGALVGFCLALKGKQINKGFCLSIIPHYLI
jgi:hypothetical protein